MASLRAPSPAGHRTSYVADGLAFGTVTDLLAPGRLRAPTKRDDTPTRLRSTVCPRQSNEQSGVMKHKTIEDISKRMAGIDIAILSTHTQNGQIANRPMSNNGDVAYDGTSYYFTFE